MSTADPESSLSGYLYKKTQDGRWQRRWFETNGIYLTYYKSRKMEKLLAALSLPQVGQIKKITADGETGLFSIELNSRIYTLRAKSDEEAEQWVKVLTNMRNQGVSTSSIILENNARNISTSGSVTGSNTSDSSALKKSMEGAEGGWMKTGRRFGCCGC